jgi:hypothetical protein
MQELKGKVVELSHKVKHKRKKSRGERERETERDIDPGSLTLESQEFLNRENIPEVAYTKDQARSFPKVK